MEENESSSNEHRETCDLWNYIEISHISRRERWKRLISLRHKSDITSEQKKLCFFLCLYHRPLVQSSSSSEQYSATSEIKRKLEKGVKNNSFLFFPLQSEPSGRCREENFSLQTWPRTTAEISSSMSNERHRSLSDRRMNDYPLLHSLCCGIVDTWVMVASRFQRRCQKQEKTTWPLTLCSSCVFDKFFLIKRLRVCVQKHIDSLWSDREQQQPWTFSNEVFVHIMALRFPILSRLAQ